MAYRYLSLRSDSGHRELRWANRMPLDRIHQEIFPTRMKLLLSAYACLPNAGSEPGNGWNWAVHLARRGIEVTVLTRAENRDEIEAYQTKHTLANLHFAYVAIPGHMIRTTTGLHYFLWQWLAVGVARQSHRRSAFQLIHHVTYTSIHVPTQLWRLGIPTVFGPVGGGQTTPSAMLEYFGDARLSEVQRTILTRLLAFSPFHRYWLSRMSAIFAANQETLALIRALGRPDARLQFDNGVSENCLATQPKIYSGDKVGTRFLWVGRMLPRKALPMALDALSMTTTPSTLTIVGDGLSSERVRSMIRERRLDDRVYWEGRRLSLEEVRSEYVKHDALLFTSVRETSGVQLLEAMALGLPVICLDLHGASDVVPDNAGFKVRVTTPVEVTLALAAAMDKFSGLGCDVKEAMSSASLEFAKKNTWPERAQKAEELYRELLSLNTRALRDAG